MTKKQSISRNTEFIKQKADELGFLYCGISKAAFLEDEAPHLEKWLIEGKQGGMQYMSNHFDKRLDPTLLVEGTKSVISLLYNYYPNKGDIPTDPAYKISTYAWGEDYHFVIRDKMSEFIMSIRNEIGEVGGRAFVDSAPILEKAWAKKSGAGWVGKNGNLIRPHKGSFFFLAEMLLDLELIPDEPIRDYCGTCTRCMDACPTNALDQPYTVDATKCISYLTIELKESKIPDEFKGKMNNWIFGCDICQDVCPWNRFSVAHNESKFKPLGNFITWNKTQWLDLTEDIFRETFRNSPIKRTAFKGMKRNILFVQNNRN